MELRHLRYFVAVAEEGSVTRAAARLGIQQPPLGQQIRALEQELRVDLFQRSPRRLDLNANGAVLLEKAREILSQVDEAVDHVRRLDRGESGHITVGFTTSASLHSLTPRILRHFRAAYPLADVEVQEHESYELILALTTRRIDAAFLHVSPDHFPDLASIALAQESMVLAVPRDHPLAARAHSITLQALADQDFVAYRRVDGPGIFAGIERAFAVSGHRLRVVDNVQRLMAAINLVAAGRGVTLVPSSVRIFHPDAITYLPLAADTLPPLPLFLVHRRTAELALVRNFIATTRSLIAG